VKRVVVDVAENRASPDAIGRILGVDELAQTVHHRPRVLLPSLQPSQTHHQGPQNFREKERESNKQEEKEGTQCQRCGDLGTADWGCLASRCASLCLQAAHGGRAAGGSG